MPTGPERRGVFAVIGGTGFLGGRIAERLVRDGRRVRIVARHSERSPLAGHAEVETCFADIRDPDSLARAVEGGQAVMNAASLYLERRDATFDDIHVKGARSLAECAAAAGVPQLAHVSGIGSDPDADDAYIRARGRGEEVVRAAFPEVVLARPAVMFDHGGAFLGPILRLLHLPVFPLFGDGSTRLQPAFVDDVARAVATSVQRPDAALRYDLGGPDVYTYRDLVRSVGLMAAGRNPRMVSAPFPLWRAAACVAEHLPGQPLTRHQVALMRWDNVASEDGMRALSVEPRSLESVVKEMVAGR